MLNFFFLFLRSFFACGECGKIKTTENKWKIQGAALLRSAP